MKRTSEFAFPEKSEAHEDDECNVLQSGSIYAAYRYTFVEGLPLDQQIYLVKDIVKFIMNNYACNNYYVAAIEKFNKFGNETAPHCHICFMTTGKMDTIRKALKRKLDVGKATKHCLKPFVEIDHEKFWRYPLKQQMHGTVQWYDYGSFTEEQIQVMLRVANESYRTIVGINQDKEDKTVDKRTFSDRLYAALDTHMITCPKTDIIDLFRQSLYFCVLLERKLISENSLKNHVYFYALDRKIISYDDYMENVLKLKFK